MMDAAEWRALGTVIVLGVQEGRDVDWVLQQIATLRRQGADAERRCDAMKATALEANSQAVRMLNRAEDAERRVARLETALRKLQENDPEPCRCDHATDDCCAKVADSCCPQCEFAALSPEAEEPRHG